MPNNVSFNNNSGLSVISLNIAKTSDALSESARKISSGDRISSAKDDPTGYALGKKLKISSTVLQSSFANTSQALATIDIANSALENIADVLRAMLDTSSQAVSSIYYSSSPSLNDQLQNMMKEIDRLANTTSFNGINLLDGSLSASRILNTITPAASSDYKVVGSFDDPIISGVSFGSSFNNVNLLSSFPNINVSYQNASNTAIFSVSIGENTYSYSSSNTNTNGTIILQNTSSTDLNDNITLNVSSMPISNTNDASYYQNLLNKSLSTVSITQTRNVGSVYNAAGAIYKNLSSTQIGTLTGSSFSISSNNFLNIALSDIQVSSPATIGSDVEVSVNLSGAKYVGTITNGALAKNATLTFKNIADPTKILFFKNGDADLTISSSADAIGFQQALNNAFSIKNPNGITFQVGLSSPENISLKIPSANSKSIFLDSNYSPADINVDTVEDAQNAVKIITNALDKITSIQVSLGSYQNRFEFSQKQIRTSIISMDDAASVFLDTDYSSESTNKSNLDVLFDAAISALAKANNVVEKLLKLFS